ncbi:response regulator transcription factor [Pelagicoccus mobilis]|uniref:Response regulator n=1 Tax=Pelagicoccus mobilis TaxID=415221 RepID=A0A934S6H6_9BACT|nr:response regulator [Pelagicoccus mobilis]MBK1879828.1 response regulator [Pelagicoccus mobilis]
METPYDLSAFRHRNILIVDDEPAMHQMFSTCLHPEIEDDSYSLSDDGEILVDSRKAIYNFNVFTAESGEQGLEICKAQAKRNAPIQLAFVDMRMKGWDGVETVKNIMEHDPRITFIIITGFPDDTREQVAERIGAAQLQVFPKPTKLEEIYQSAYSMTKRWNRLHGDN